MDPIEIIHRLVAIRSQLPHSPAGNDARKQMSVLIADLDRDRVDRQLAEIVHQWEANHDADLLIIGLRELADSLEPF